jgi:hypothetical protein
VRQEWGQQSGTKLGTPRVRHGLVLLRCGFCRARNEPSGKDMRKPTSANDPVPANSSSTGAQASEVAQSEGAKSEARAWTMSRLKRLYDYVAREPLPTTITALVQRARN